MYVRWGVALCPASKNLHPGSVLVLAEAKAEISESNRVAELFLRKSKWTSDMRNTSSSVGFLAPNTKGLQGENDSCSTQPCHNGTHAREDPRPRQLKVQGLDSLGKR